MSRRLRSGEGPIRRTRSVTETPKKRIRFSEAWQDARELVRAHRPRLLLGLGLMLINRAAGFVLPLSPSRIDEALRQHRPLFTIIAGVLGAAVLVQAYVVRIVAIWGVAAQRAISDMRKRVMEHVTRLPVRYFDSAQTGILISRVMEDAEGVRNLVGTGLVQLASSVVTAAMALGWLLYLDWKLTLFNLVFLGLFGGGMTFAFRYLRPLFRERGRIHAEITGRLTETLGGIRIVKAYNAERREQLVFTRGAHRLFRLVARTMTGVSAAGALSGVIAGVIGVILVMVGGPAILAGSMTLGEFGTTSRSRARSRHRCSSSPRSARSSPKRLRASTESARYSARRRSSRMRGSARPFTRYAATSRSRT